MGNFYTSFTVRSADWRNAVEAMKGRTAVVSPSANGYTVIWDEESDTQDPSVIDALGQRLATTLGAPVLAVLNHDDDIFCYWLYSAQGKVDEYNSAPGYFEGEDAPPSGGSAQLLVRTMSSGASEDSIEQILRSTAYVFAYERHVNLINALGMPEFCACTGYNYISQGEIPEGMGKDDLTFTE